jgi:transcriptional regulator with XRE-family HTH domain
MARQASATLTGSRGSEGRISGYVLKVIRESLGHTQDRLAERLGVSAATVQGWESGRRPLMAMPAGNLMALRSEFRSLGAAPALLDAFTQGLEADLFVGEILATPHDQARSGKHLLGGWVVTRPFTEMTAWPIGGAAPHAVAHSTRHALRHGPVPSGPAFGVDERRHIVTHLQTVAERAARRTVEGLLLARQAYYLLGFDSSPETTVWLAHMYRTDRQAVRPVPGWSPGWPLARSTASALTRLGDPEPMRRFIADQLCNEAGECANLNYWAFWVGDFAEQQTGDAFIGTTPLTAWHGNRLMRHLLDRLHGNIGFLELNIHTLWSLIRIRPEMITGPPVAQEMAAKVERLLDESLVSAASRRELDALRYAIAITRRY